MKEKFFMNGIFRDTERGPWPFYSRCKNCGATFFPAELYRCNQCVSKDLEQLDLPEYATMETFTVIYRPVNMYKTPHCVATAEFPEAKIRVKGVLDVDDDYRANMEKGHEFKAGTKLQVVVGELWEDPEKDTRYIGYKFRPIEEEK